MDSAAIMKIALVNQAVIPAFNVPYLPMVEPLVHAIRAEKSFGFLAVARLEWLKFQSKSMDAVREEYKKYIDPRHVRLHLDHIPVIDEDQKCVPYAEEIAHALEIGYESVMIDGSRLSLEDNIAATREAAEIAHAAGRPIEAELGAVAGHESDPLPPYEELFTSKKGFTKVEDARRFARETGCDWLSVAIGNIHGAVAEGLREQKKPAARLDLDHLSALFEVTQLPMVLHGGSGIPQEYVLEAIKRGITKINIGTELRQAYLKGSNNEQDVPAGQNAVYKECRRVISERLKMAGSADLFV